MSDSAHTFYWKNTINITPVHTLSGYSRAAENTGFYCRELEMAFDAGVQTNDVPAYICLTHLHNDHMCALNKMLIANPKNPIIFIPNNNKLEDLLVAALKHIYLASKFIHPESIKGKDPLTKYPYSIVKLDVGQSYKFKDHVNGSLHVEGLPSYHGVASISFGIYETRKRCKPEYKNLDRHQYAKMRKDGIDFMENYKFPIICFMSDTNYTAFDGIANPIFQYPIIVVECTFLEPGDLLHAKKKNHMHWSQIDEIKLKHPDNKFILTHFSKRYTWSEVKHFFDGVNAIKPLNNIILWLHTGPVEYAHTEAIKELLYQL